MLSLPKGGDRSFALWKNHVWNTGMRTKSVTLLLLTDTACDMYSLAADSNDEYNLKLNLLIQYYYNTIQYN